MFCCFFLSRSLFVVVLFFLKTFLLFKYWARLFLQSLLNQRFLLLLLFLPVVLVGLDLKTCAALSLQIFTISDTVSSIFISFSLVILCDKISTFSILIELTNCDFLFSSQIKAWLLGFVFTHGGVLSRDYI